MPNNDKCQCECKNQKNIVNAKKIIFGIEKPVNM